MRLPNSMAWWIAGAAPGTGTSEPSWHNGQVLQPRPEPVTRTSEPVTVMPPWHRSRIIARTRCSFRDGPTVVLTGVFTSTPVPSTYQT